MKDQQPGKRPTSGFSRREFLRGSGAAAAATALATGPGLVEQAEAQQGNVAAARSKQTITLNVNGKDQQVSVEGRMTLLEVIRYQLNLTGAKPVSDVAGHGGSTVLIDGKPASAGNTLALDCRGKKIQTVESLGPQGVGDKPDAVVAAFVHNDGMQCGFCTPGFVVAVKAFLTANPKATEAQIRQGLNGNLCRCGTYANVIQAALEVVKGGA
jgi:xanthine dehydrogenase YagT iron-sulfur-binding subunit